MYRRNIRRCCCMNNCNNFSKDMIETKCSNIQNSCACNESNCECGFDDEIDTTFPEFPMYGQSYVPIQQMEDVFIPCVGLKMGTIFPELVSPYSAGQSMEEIRNLENMNEIGEGCNSCQ